MQNLESTDKILKIFSRVHCFNQDQLPRYVNGRLTHIEKHLLEQHLVNCELCSEAVEILQKAKFRPQYSSMNHKVLHHIRTSNTAAPAYEAERYQKRVEVTEKFLTYFWSTVGIALVIGCVLLTMHQVKKEQLQRSFAQQAVPVARPDTNLTKSVAVVDTIAVQAPAKDSVSDDKSLYKSAMDHYFHGDLNEAIPKFVALTKDTTSSYRELAHYQLGMCYKYTRQKVKARQAFKDLMNLNGVLKRRAQIALLKL